MHLSAALGNKNGDLMASGLALDRLAQSCENTVMKNVAALPGAAGTDLQQRLGSSEMHRAFDEIMCTGSGNFRGRINHLRLFHCSTESIVAFGGTPLAVHILSSPGTSQPDGRAAGPQLRVLQRGHR